MISPTNYESKENINKNLKGRFTRISIKGLSEEELKKLQDQQDKEDAEASKLEDKKTDVIENKGVKRHIDYVKLLVKNWPFELET